MSTTNVMGEYTFDDFRIRIDWQHDGYVATVLGLAAEGVEASGSALELRHPTEAAARVAAEMFIKEKLADLQRSKAKEFDEKQGEQD